MNEHVERTLEIVTTVYGLALVATTWCIVHNYPVDASALSFTMILIGSVIFSAAVSVVRLLLPGLFNG